MAELRWHPFTKDWVMIASNRQNRPQMPKDWCPFCPGSGKVPENYDVYKYDNDFPALSQNPSEPDDVANDFFKVKPSYGKCEVVLYSPGHTTTLPELSVDHITKLVDLWCERFDAIREDENIKAVVLEMLKKSFLSIYRLLCDEFKYLCVTTCFHFKFTPSVSVSG